MKAGLLGLRSLLLLLALAACGPSPSPWPISPSFIPPPDPGQVESVIFLLGDAGVARWESSPLLRRLQHDVEVWSGLLERDSAVAVLALGDIVYPVGLHPPGHGARASDSAVVMAQVRTVLGPAARSRATAMYFMAGNHDWGLREHRAGFARLRNLDEFLMAARARTGAHVSLVPEAGTGGPFVLDFGRHLRLLLLDTAWWLLEADERRRAAVLEGIDAAMEEAASSGREVVLAAHHPFRSVGPHGGVFPFWETAGARYILARSGAILQDITSGPYRGLEFGLREIFERRGAPLAFAGGHEHSLQVMEAVRPTDPRHILVSGSGSKLTGVGREEGVVYAASAPGYMRLVIERSGAVSLFVEGAPREYLKCGGSETERERCMAEGFAAFGTLHSQRLP